ncbi:MAG TPA: ABC transporter substrate-binding protein [Planctomycetota bacterium]|jgi:peptide/nickel transport system substrate-binding protein|nr:ABC transporter substrate-binding protein [Planctomycetota bacterium]
MRRLAAPAFAVLALLLLLLLLRQQDRLARAQRGLRERVERIEEALARGAKVETPAAANRAEVPPGDPEGPYPELGRRGGTLRVPLSSPPDTFNPITAKSLSGFFVSLFVCEPLTELDPLTAEPVPVLAESWEHSEDGLTWTFRLREGLLWSDGVPLTADDVVFSLETLLDPRVASYSAQEFRYPTERGEETVRFERVDDRTVRFRQPVPFVAFPNKLAYKAIVPKHRLEAARARGEFQTAWSVTTPPEEIVGSGPFRIERYGLGSEVVMRRNPLHWRRDAAGQPLPYLDGLVWPICESPDAALLQFQAGKLDLLCGANGTGIRGSDVEVLRRGEASGGFRLVDAGAGVDFTYLTFNQNAGRDPRTGRPCVDPRKLAWFRDATFRRAVAHCVDREAIVQNVYNGLAEPADSVYARGTGRFHNPDVSPPLYDLGRARALLDSIDLRDRDGDGVREAGDGTPVEFSILHAARRSAEEEGSLSILADRLADVGVRARPRRVDPNGYARAIFDTFDWEAALGSDSGAASDPKGIDPLWCSSGPYHLWFPRQESPSTPWESRIDAIFREASLEFDPGRRLAFLHEFQEIVAREVPVILTVQRRTVFAVRRNLRNFRAAPAEPNPIKNVDFLFFR